ncbi:LamG domain-containing protein [Rhizobacter sp. Root1221]|uniref:LamG domain-containing protein n=1 Tax=Rhizobacter sp. Root1221 TaxID=1736433 RepID=UPI0009E6DE5D|nr:LamG domain-containing protein [Rhizobacter sp. Root1221]
MTTAAPSIDRFVTDRFGSGTGRYLMLARRSRSGLLRFAITVSGTYGEQFVESTAAPPIGRWVHLAVTLSGRRATLYVDGLAAGVNTDMALTPAQVGPTPNNWIGRSQFVSDPGFNGRFNDFRIWRSALDATAVAALAAA